MTEEIKTKGTWGGALLVLIQVVRVQVLDVRSLKEML